ncbi:ScbA/BarX family gamma-butyrolactone biosynthesis protein [Streptomyces sp. NPDC059373]
MCALAVADRATPQPSPAAEPELFLQTVPRTLVHRAAVSEVLLTGIRDDGQDSFRVGAQWPRGHSYYRAVAQRWHDPVLLGESIRQAVLLVSHEGLHIPLGHCFFSHTTSYAADADGILLADRPAEVLMTARIRDIKRRGRLVGGFDVDVECHRDGQRIGRGHMSLTCVPAATYRRLRGDRVDARAERSAAPPVAPETVGRRYETDVVLGTTAVERVWTLRADPGHPVLFDHPVDHVPGMVVMEGARQAALATLGSPDGLAVECAITYGKFIEFATPCLVSAEAATPGPDGRQVVNVHFAQDGATVATAAVTVVAAP